MIDQKSLATKLLSDPDWRMNNLYYIIDKTGKRVKFKFNLAQRELYNDIQLGISTFVCILFLDRCLWNSNKAAGIIAHTMEDAEQMFRRVKYAYDNLPEDITNIISADNDTAQMLKFSNGSSISVGTSLRSSTFHYLHISEL